MTFEHPSIEPTKAYSYYFTLHIQRVLVTLCDPSLCLATEPLLVFIVAFNPVHLFKHGQHPLVAVTDLSLVSHVLGPLAAVVDYDLKPGYLEFRVVNGILREKKNIFLLRLRFNSIKAANSVSFRLDKMSTF